MKNQSAVSFSRELLLRGFELHKRESEPWMLVKQVPEWG